nr:hypothetical protein [Actinomycetota bacterium]
MGSATSKAPPDDPQILPFAAFLTQQNKGALHTDLSEAFHALLAAVKDTGKAGTLTLQVKVKPAGKGDSERVLISDTCVLKAPRPDARESLFFLDDAGNPTRSDPRQQE